MKLIGRIWSSLTGPEKGVAVACALALLSTIALAGYALLDRPGDVSNPDAEFREPTEKEVAASKPPDRQVDWPLYGYDNERTKFLNSPKVRPPLRKLWRYQQDQLIEFAPIIAGKRMYAIDNDAVFFALNVDTGKVVWKERLGGLNASSPAFVNGVLYAVNLDPGQALAIRANDGKVLWKVDLPSRAESSPMVIRERMYFGTEDGTFYALDIRNGREAWSTDLAGSVKAAPAFADGRLYVGDYAGEFYAINADDGSIAWQAGDLGGSFGRSGRFYSTPAVAFGRVYVGNVDGRVYSFEQSSGELAWTFSAGNFVYSGIAAADTKGTDPAVYFGSHDGFTYAVGARTGNLIWQESPGGQVSGPATVIGGIVYVSTFSGNSTTGFDIRTGRRVFKFDEGEYGPAVSDGQRLYVVGGNSITAFKPVKVDGRYKSDQGKRGIVPPSELREIRKQAEKKGGGKNEAPPQAAKDKSKANNGGNEGKRNRGGGGSDRSKGSKGG